MTHKINRMKTLAFKTCIWLFVCLNILPLQSQSSFVNDSDSLICLRIEGKILSTSKRGDCLIELFHAGALEDSMRLDSRAKHFGFELIRNSSYTIRISSNGFVTKLVCIDTKVSMPTKGIYRFKFTTGLMETAMAKRLNQDALEFPVALVYFDPTLKCFDYARDYTKSIKREWLKPNSSPNNLAVSGQ